MVVPNCLALLVGLFTTSSTISLTEWLWNSFCQWRHCYLSQTYIGFEAVRGRNFSWRKGCCLFQSDPLVWLLEYLWLTLLPELDTEQLEPSSARLLFYEFTHSFPLAFNLCCHFLCVFLNFFLSLEMEGIFSPLESSPSPDHTEATPSLSFYPESFIIPITKPFPYEIKRSLKMWCCHCHLGWTRSREFVPWNNIFPWCQLIVYGYEATFSECHNILVIYTNGEKEIRALQCWAGVIWEWECAKWECVIWAWKYHNGSNIYSYTSYPINIGVEWFTKTNLFH